MTFNQSGIHAAKVILTDDVAPTIATPIANLTVNEKTLTSSIDLTNVFKDLDTTTDVSQIIKSVQVAGNARIATPTIIGNTLTLKYEPYAFGSSAITIRGTSGGKTVDNTFTLTRNPSNLPANTVSKIIYGNDSNNLLIGGNASNIISGYGGSDMLTAGNNNDVLIGGTGSDTLIGGWWMVDGSLVCNGYGEVERYHTCTFSLPTPNSQLPSPISHLPSIKLD